MANLFSGKLARLFGMDDTLPWTDAVTIAKCEEECLRDESDIDSRMKLAWSLVHSQQVPDVHRGIAMLEAQLGNRADAARTRETLYLLAVGHFRSGDYARSRNLLQQALQISPNFRQAQALMKMVGDRIQADGVIGMGLAAAAVGVVAGGVAALVASARR
ncbi:hypothetical protein CBR_g30283 [Chara braunii]|uniref:Mitochondrial fission 1 protein n=1 Tax=Chara braunii TaxID=69332 RepID=A0A388LCW3_CHABU|nr:hypothetical protein CBR_g30283 [Chara braunii]|eukprot:GBG80022.1 hypothetical protein CBR_g30283 [Chara braunii]